MSISPEKKSLERSDWQRLEWGLRTPTKIILLICKGSSHSFAFVSNALKRASENLFNKFPMVWMKLSQYFSVVVCQFCGL